MVAPGIMPIIGANALPLPPLTGLIAWLKTPISFGVNSSPLTGSWPDDSGNGHSYTFNNNGQPGDNNPIYLTNQVNGVPGVNFNVNGFIQSDLSFSNEFPGGGSMFLIVKSGASSNGLETEINSGFGITTGSGAPANYPYSDGNIYESFLADHTYAGPVTSAVTITNWHLYEVVATASSYDMYQNGSNIFTRASNTLYEPTYTEFGRWVGSSVGHWDGHIAEILIYNVTNVRAGVEAYSLAKYTF
jgi:hypothetical protein